MAAAERLSDDLDRLTIVGVAVNDLVAQLHDSIAIVRENKNLHREVKTLKTENLILKAQIALIDAQFQKMSRNGIKVNVSRPA